MFAKSKFGVILNLSLLFFLLFLPFGCARETPVPPPQPPEQKEKEVPEEPEQKVEVITLFFANEEADMLVKEEREVETGERDIKVVALEELIKGPADDRLGRTVPQDVRVLEVTLENGTAVANFSEELRSSHWGGSTGEILTVYSIVNTLASLPQVERVKFLIEGEEVDTLVGHMELTDPLDPDWGLVD